MDENVVERFFKYDYQDRGIKKWQGYFLSDHTQEINKIKKVAKQNATFQLKKQMSADAIGKIINEALIKHLTIKIQLCEYVDEEMYVKQMTGKVTGSDEGYIKINNHFVADETVVNVAII